jgi:hypothetical protein
LWYSPNTYTLWLLGSAEYVQAATMTLFFVARFLHQASQAYPEGYGKATATLMLSSPIDVDSTEWCVQTIDDDTEFERYTSGGAEQWADANLAGVWKIVIKRRRA